MVIQVGKVLLLVNRGQYLQQYNSGMLKRRIRIQKYIASLKQKQIKKSIKNHIVLQNKVKVEEKDAKLEQNAHNPIDGTGNEILIQVQGFHNQQQQQYEKQEKPCWNDSDDEQQQVKIESRNKFKKLAKLGLPQSTTEEQYQKKLGKFYSAKFNRVNWASNTEGIEQKDINDYLNEDVYYNDKKPASKTIAFFSKTSEKHDSIVSGLDWHKNVMFTCGLDHKLKAYHFQPEQTNPQLKLKQEKDIYITDLPLSGCYFQESRLIMGSLRRNLILIDTEKWTPTFITSSFLKDHKTYQNLRAGNEKKQCAIFSNHRISLLDQNCIYKGALLANDEVQDVAFGKGDNSNKIYAVSYDSIYEWDTRTMQILNMHKLYLGFTSISASNTSISIGSKLGTVYIYPPSIAGASSIQNPIQNSNLLTHITHLSTSRSGEYTLAVSKWKANAIRVIDSMNGKSVGDWPSAKTKVGIPIAAAFNESGMYFGVGASSGFTSVYGFSNQML